MPRPYRHTVGHASQSTVVEQRELENQSVLAEARRDEERMAKYGEDDPEDPTQRKPMSASGSDEQIDPFLVSWDGEEDPSNPQNWPALRKWLVVSVTSFITVNVTFASSMPSIVGPKIAAHFHFSEEVANLITSLFLVGYIFGPMFWGPGSEYWGRRPVFIVSCVGYTLFILGQALAHNTATLLVTRFLSGFFAVAPLTIVGGVVADMFDAVGRGRASSLYSASVFLGPALGPVVGGFIGESDATWRWAFWVMLIYAGVCMVLTIAFVPETYAPILLKEKAKACRKETGNSKFYAEVDRRNWSIRELLNRTLFRPFLMLFLEPILLLITIYMSVVYGVMYALFEAFPIIFSGLHGFTPSQTGLVFIGVGVGTTISAAVNLYFIKDYSTLIKTWRGFPPPEHRLPGAMLGGPLLVIGIFWLGWTGTYPAIPWYVPMLSTIPIGASIGLIFISFLSYLVDTYLMFAASAFAANTMVRCAVAAAFPLFTVQMFENMHVNWAATLIGCIGIVLAPMPFLFYKYGSTIRERSKFAPCIDLKIAKVIEAEKVAANVKIEV